MKTIKFTFAAFALMVGIGLAGSSHSAQPAPFTQAELDQMLAPVALYPDTVLSHVLIAATYPLEVVQAARWSRHNPSLRGEEAVAAVERMNWDPSVKALVAFPELLKRLDEDLDWTQRLGDAFLMQEESVLDSIQHLRSEAYAHGHLRSNEHVRVVRETQYIYIEPARSRVVYVPYYDPRVVYVGWRWASHPPVYWHHPRGYRSHVSFYWGPAYHVAPTFFFSSFHWSRRQVVSVHHHHHYHVHHHQHRNTHRHFSSGREIARHDGARHWQHNPQHRRGVSYRPGIDERRFIQQRDANQGANTRTVAASQNRTRPQQREWANQQRSAAPIRERSRVQAQTRSTAGNTPQRGDSNRVQRQTRSGTTQATQRSGASRTTSTREDAATQRDSTRQSIATRDRTTGQERARTRADSARTEPQTRSTPQVSRQPSTQREAATRPQSRASTPATTSRGSSATARQATAPRQSQTTRGSQPSSQPQVRSSAPSSRQSAPAPRTRSSTPSRATSTAPRSSSSRSTAPRSSAPTTRSSTRSSAPTRSSGTSSAPRRSSRQID